MGTFTGTEGNDTLTGTADADTINGAAGNDTLNGEAGNDVINGEDGDDTLRGGQGDDQLYGGAGNDFLSEASGDNGPFGNDIYDGGEGSDRVSLFTAYGPGVNVDLRIATAQNTGTRGTDTFIGIEHVTASYGDNTINGNDADNWIWTFWGNDTLSVTAGMTISPSARATRSPMAAPASTRSRLRIRRSSRSTLRMA